MKTLFLYAPDRCLPTIPYSSLPALQACLRKAGHSTEIMDLNVELFDWLVQRDRVGAYYGWVRNRFAELEAKPQLDSAERAMYAFLAPLVAPPPESFARAEEAAAILRDKQRFFQPALFNQAFDDLTAVIRFLYAATPILNPENQKHYVAQLLEYSAVAGDPMSHCYEEKLADLILARQPDVLAFTIPFHNQLLEILKILRVVKRKAPHVKAVIGGPTVHDYRDTLFADGRLFDWIDYGSVGEGENAIVQLLDALEGKRDLDDVANLYYRRADGSVAVSTKSDLPVMDEAPTLDFDGVPFDRYLLPDRLANFQTSRGCYYGKCTFCGDGFRRNFRMRHADLVYEDIKSIVEQWDVKYFLFWDSLAPPRTLINVAKRLKEEGPEVYWFAETKFEYTYANPQTVKTLYEGGGRVFQFGFESAVDRVLAMIDKGNELEKVDACLNALSEVGIGVCTSWFIGFPTERENEALITYDYVSKRRDKIVMSIYSGIFNLGRDTIVYQNPDRFGVKIVEPENGEIFVDDGLPLWDKKNWNERLEQRGDLPLLCQGGYLLYHTEHPDRLRDIVAKGRTGPMARELADFASEIPERPERNRLVRYKFNPYDVAGGAVEGGYAVAYVAFHGMYYPLDRDHVAIFEGCDGRRTVADLAALSKLDGQAAQDKVAWLVDRGILIVPKPLPEYRGLARQAALA
jgi:anaerobic magnesium-protoporphyrin IX monomethyl ester cyclase